MTIQVRIGTALPAPSDETIATLESGYRLKLPAGFVALLRSGNGGVPLRPCFEQGKRERLIERMLCVLDDYNAHGELGAYDIAVVTTQIEDRLVDGSDPAYAEYVGMKILPIAALFAGDFVCLDYRGDPATPSVAVWDHERSRSLQPHLETVAPSFDAFEVMLHEPRQIRS